MVIVGAGLSGLIAAHAFPDAPLIEASAEPTASHAALLRFRSDAVANLVGIEFREVLVRKAIWFDGRLVPPDIRLANWYAQKVSHRISDRSIWNLEPVHRFIAPLDFYDRLIERVSRRVSWRTPLSAENMIDHEPPFISTIPLPQLLRITKLDNPAFVPFDYQPIAVTRFEIADCDVHQTIYFPAPDTLIYRASITGNVLIVEAMGGLDVESQFDGLTEVLAAFGGIRIIRALGERTQRYGKIVPIHDATRKELLYRLTSLYKIYSLGRFAIWKNVLLDDVVHDIAVVRRLMAAGGYDQRRSMI